MLNQRCRVKAAPTCSTHDFRALLRAHTPSSCRFIVPSGNECGWKIKDRTKSLIYCDRHAKFDENSAQYANKQIAVLQTKQAELEAQWRQLEIERIQVEASLEHWRWKLANRVAQTNTLAPPAQQQRHYLAAPPQQRHLSWTAEQQQPMITSGPTVETIDDERDEYETAEDLDVTARVDQWHDETFARIDDCNDKITKGLAVVAHDPNWTRYNARSVEYNQLHQQVLSFKPKYDTFHPDIQKVLDQALRKIEQGFPTDYDVITFNQALQSLHDFIINS